MSIIRNTSLVDIPLDDLGGITILASSDYDLKYESQNDIANSQDLNDFIASGDIVFIDINGNPLTQQESLDTQNNISAVQPAITIQENGVNVAGTPHNTLNFIGSGVSVASAVPGVVDIDVFNGLGSSIIDGETILTLIDTTRGNKTLSVETLNYLLVEDSVSNGTYLDISYLTNTNSGYVMPMNATIVGVTLHKISGSSTTGMEYNLYVDGALHTSNLISSYGSAEETKKDNTLNIDMNANQKITIRALRYTGSSTQTDVSVMLYIKWRL